MSTRAHRDKHKGTDPLEFGILIFQMPVPELAHAARARSAARSGVRRDPRRDRRRDARARASGCATRSCAQWLGLSRTPVREALSRLEQDGLVETAPQRYTRVAPLDRRAARDAFPVVAAMHALAAELAVPRLTDTRPRARCAPPTRRFAAALQRQRRRRARWPRTTPSTASSSTPSANGEIPRVLDRLMPRVRRLERLRFGSLAGRASVEQHDGIIAAAAAEDAANDRRAGARELALARNPDRPELRMTAIDPARHPRRRDARRGPRAARRRGRPARDAARGARRRRPQRALARRRVHQPARARGAREPDRAAAPLRRGRPARRRGPHRPGQPLVRRHAPHRRDRGAVRRAAQARCSRPTTPSTGWWRA